MSENEDSTMSDESDAETSKSHQKEDIFGKYTDKEYDPPSYSLGEDDESDSLQQSSGSKYAPSQLQQNNIGSKYTQSQLGSGSMFKHSN